MQWPHLGREPDSMGRLRRVECAASSSATDEQRVSRPAAITSVTAMMKFMKPIATTISGAFKHAAAVAIGVAIETFGSAFTLIAVMKMVMVLVPQ